MELLWITNIPTPYRFPLWLELASKTDLTVAALAATESNRSWNMDMKGVPYTFINLHAKKVGHSDDSALYAPSGQLLRLIARRPSAVVFDGWESPAYLAARWLAGHLGIPIVVSYRSTLATHRFAGGPVTRVRQWFFTGGDVILTAGPASSEAVTAMGIPRERIVEGFNTVDVDRFQKMAHAARLGSHQPTGHRFLYVGQLIERKNLDTLMLAFSRARSVSDTLTIVGTGPFESRLREMSHHLGLNDSVIFAGHYDVEQLGRAYGEAHSLVLPSLQEVWGLVVNEALAAGLHAVVSDRCGVARSVRDMPGVTVSRPDAPALTEAMKQSAALWNGPIADPPIGRHTPAALASIILTVVDDLSNTSVARRRRSRRTLRRTR